MNEIFQLQQQEYFMLSMKCHEQYKTSYITTLHYF